MFNYLVERRKKFNLSRDEISKKIHVSVRTYEKYERKELDITQARFDVVIKLCEVLELNPMQFYYEFLKENNVSEETIDKCKELMNKHVGQKDYQIAGDNEILENIKNNTEVGKAFKLNAQYQKF